MYVTTDNAGDIRINYTSNVELANEINILARKLRKPPLVSHRATMGGYRYPILEYIAGGRQFQILKTAIPQDSQEHSKALTRVLKDPETVYSYVDATTITIIQIEGWNAWEESLATYGFRVMAEQKTFKRLKTVNRPFRFWCSPDYELRVAIVDDDDYTDSDIMHEMSPEIRERLLDGGFVISRALYEQCLANVECAVSSGNITTADELRSAMLRDQSWNIRTFNARIFGRFHWVGLDPDDPFHDKVGMLKGQAFVSVSDACERMHVDVIAARSALKSEVSADKTFVLLDPQTAKYRVNGDLQSITHNPALYDPEQTKLWVKIMLLTAYEDLKADRLMEHWYQTTNPEFYATNEIKYNQGDLITLTKWNARAWVMSGMKLTQSPWLFEQMARNILSIINTSDIKKMRLPIPCAVRCQVISQSMASMAGADDEEMFEVLPGSIRWLKSHQVLVVSDEDWIEMYESHGGNDLDDFFVGYWRTINGQRKVVIMRSPNDYGEYSIFDYVEGDWYPVEELSNGRFVLFPEVVATDDMWPKRLSEAVRDGTVIYEGLPSSHESHVTEPPHPYSVYDTVRAIENNVGSQSCVGANVNARSLWSLSMRCHREIQLAPMEACIDTGAQGGHALDIEAVTKEAQDIMETIFADPTAKIDTYMWVTRFQDPYKDRVDVEGRLSSASHVSKLHAFRMNFIRSFMKMVRNYISNPQQLEGTINPLIHTLGKYHLKDGVNILRSARQTVALSRQFNGERTDENTWNDIHEYVLNEIEQYESIYAQHDFILGIYSACLKLPTHTTGKISDQLVMNPALFDRLMAALRYYGIAGHLVLDKAGRITCQYTESWDLHCVNCDFTLTVTDPVRMQKYHRMSDSAKLCPSCKAAAQ